MSRSKLNMDELFSSHFEGYTEEPSPGMWNRISTRLFWKEFFRFRANTLNVYYTAAVIAVLTASAVWLTSPGDQPNQPVPASEIQDTGIPSAESMPGESKEEPLSDQEVAGENIPTETGTPQDRKESSRKDKTSAAAAAGREKEQESGIETERETSGDQTGTEQQENLETEPAAVTVGFEASDYRGCAPLAVTFTNRSENAADYRWSFGDGGSSDEEHPSYVFDEPGEYTVSLKAEGPDGKEYLSTRRFEVFVTPRAQFEFDEDVKLSNGRPVNFYNYSRDADYYLWDFGDSEQSNLSDPVHYYGTPGEYDITLRAWTANGCADSMTVKDAFSDLDNSILFPNVFTPNLSGPTGGYYTPGDPDNEVFHPVVNGEIVEYELKVYNRVGQVIFESNDINIGWDGYYQDQLAGQGVYIWKARGRFANGKTFVKSGDITLIWK